MKLNDKFTSYIIWVSVILGSIIFIFISILFALKGNLSFLYEIDNEMVSAYGTILGGVIGTIFTVIATLLIWFTYQSQKKELVETIKIARTQSETSKKQNETLNIQKFEATFFNMSSTLIEIPNTFRGSLPYVKDMFKGTYTVSKSRIDIYIGKEYLENALKNLNSTFEKVNNWKSMDDSTLISTASKIYDTFCDKYLSELDHYFRYFFNILKFIDNSNIENNKLYIDLLQAQLSKNELGLIFYNGIGRIGNPKLYPLLEKYNFLENLNKSVNFLHDNKQTVFYPYTTFKFLSKEQKFEIILKSMLDNPDNTKSGIYNYYLNKYNLTQGESKEFKEANKKQLRENKLIPIQLEIVEPIIIDIKSKK